MPESEVAALAVTADAQGVSRLKLFHSDKDGSRTGNEVVPYQVVHRCRVDFRSAFQTERQGAGRRRERQFSVGLIEKERLFAERIPGQVQGAAARVH